MATGYRGPLAPGYCERFSMRFNKREVSGAYFFGFISRPRNKMLPVRLSRIRKRNG